MKNAAYICIIPNVQVNCEATNGNSLLPSLYIKVEWLTTRPISDTLAVIEVMAMIKKGQMNTAGGNLKTPAEQFYLLAA